MPNEGHPTETQNNWAGYPVPRWAYWNLCRRPFMGRCPMLLDCAPSELELLPTGPGAKARTF
jgi:hypothetical protein